jgi:GTP-binding protein
MTRIVDTRLVASSGRVEKFPEESLPEVAFAGRSNVGKSSVLNALCNRRDLFKTSKTPGRTRTVVHAEARLESGAKIFLVDLPGYGYARVSKAASAAWGELIEGYLRNRATLHLVVLIVDARRGLEEEEADLASFLGEARIPYLLAATKMDRIAKSGRKLALEKLRRETGVRVYGLSSATRQGVDELLEAIARACGYDK